jgi:hypothetical protein
MKKIIYSILAVSIFAACELEEINENPNVPQEVPLSTLLPPAQKALTDVQGRELFQYTNIFSQHIEGVDNQPLLIEGYQPDELFVGNMWSDIYVGSLVNLKIIIDRADAGGSPHYAGVARILQVQALGFLTDVWGNVPFTQAAEGSAFPNPEYDSQELLYTRIAEILDRAVFELQADSSVFSPTSDDIMYGGDLSSWIATAHLLKARYLMHTTKRNPDIANEVLIALSEGLTSSAQDWEYPYLGTGTDINPLNSFFTITPYAEADAQFVQLMEDLGDPRIDYSFKIIPFTGGRRRPSDYFAGPEAPVKLASYLEQLYLLSEARLRTGDTPGAELALQEAIELSMDQLSSGEITQEDIDTYISNNGILSGNFESDLETIIREKYIALFTTPEPWTDYRRTGFPNLVPNDNGSTASNPSGEIPRRLIYPQSERLRNENFPAPAPNMQDRFWWDE